MRTHHLALVALAAILALPAATALEVRTTAQATAPPVPPAPALPAAPAVPPLPASAGAAPSLPTAPVSSPSIPALPSAQSLPVQAPDLSRASVPATPLHVDAKAHAQSRAAAMAQMARDAAPVAARVAPPAVAAAGLLALLQALGAWRLLATGGVALYSRLTRSNLLDNAHRDAVYKLIQETPGLNVSEIAQRTSLGWGTTVYHLDRLEREGFVAAERGGLSKCYFAVGLVDREARRTAAALKDGTRRDLAAVLLAQPGITQAQLAATLGMSASAASKQVTKLETAGLVRREREWKTVRLFPGPALAVAP